ncbi:hypothetical protein HMPREF0591_0302 [Mycobacterium parascrofulaceum ATCC BAA-614]|uniref:Uncharacterized protein n=1 Tax=Mycobacterium parascrofulaceum ATCC BAA-614 TaxID=525368 RepID=D5P2A8_9MYCO|nr:hypothetical protein HMPREF0591_0302 [Mycobacterium parascrofulaceum ATCC BAA-614]
MAAGESDDTLRTMPEATADTGSVPTQVVAGHGTALLVGDASCDAAVSSLVQCSASDVGDLLAKIRRGA